MKNKASSLCVMGFFVLVGCDYQEPDREDLKDEHTTSAFEATAINIPEAKDIPQAKEIVNPQDQVEAFTFGQAKASDSAAELEAYLASYPDGRFQREATQVLEDLRYHETITSPSLAERVQFLDKYPQGAHAEELYSSLEKFPAWAASKELGDLIHAGAPKASIVIPMAGLMGDEGPGIEGASMSTSGLGVTAAAVRSALNNGAVPGAVCIVGFREAFSGTDRMSTGSPGHVTPLQSGGLSLIDYCKKKKMLGIAKILEDSTVRGLVSATPRFISCGLLRPQQEIVRTVRIEKFASGFKMPKLQVSLRGYGGDLEYPENVSLNIEPFPDGNGYEIIMTLRAPDESPGSFRGVLVVEVDNAIKQTLELQFTGIVRAEKN